MGLVETRIPIKWLKWSSIVYLTFIIFSKLNWFHTSGFFTCLKLRLFMCLLFNSFKEHILNTQQTLGTVLGAQNRKIRHTFIFFLLIFKNMFGYPGLCCCTRAFSSCGKQGPLSCCGTWSLGCRGSVVAYELSSCSTQAY